ncbi:MAG TPA: HD domain-containing phosphohydrolase [Syntrophorhabdales bacterium]|nr:HD domain-containing phosphohydrolase [Syntrophorhabdales bacterium]
MQRTVSVNLGNLVLSLSDAMDLASPLLAQHQHRTAFVVSELGRAAVLPDERLENAFMAALLHDVGALSLEEKIALHNWESNRTDEHCIRGQTLLETVPWLKEAAALVRFHHTEWQRFEEPISSPLVFDSQLLFIADYLERLIDRNRYILHQHEEILSKLRRLAGASVHSDMVDLMETSCVREEFWLDLCSPRLYSVLLNEGPFRRTEIGLAKISLIAELFRNIIDFRSRFTAAHSSGVATAASFLSRIFGLTEHETALLEVAGNFHDIGKLVIPNSILEKPGPLTKEETAVMKSHAYYTYSVIRSIGGIKDVAEWAAYHHERLDGSGYPFHCTADELSTGARIVMVADIFTALAEERPYKKGMSRREITDILSELSRRELLDPKIVTLLLENHEDILKAVLQKQAEEKEFYEKQFAFLEAA